MGHQHVAVWIDRKEAKVFHIEPDGFDVSKVAAPHHHVTRKAAEQGHHAGEEHYFRDVAAALRDAGEILVVGPSSAKLDLMRYLRGHDLAIEKKVVGIETLDHPSNAELAAYVRHYFVAKDRMLGVSP